MTQELRYTIPGFAKYSMTRTGEVRYIYNDKVMSPIDPNTHQYLYATDVMDNAEGKKYVLWSDVERKHVFVSARRIEALIERDQRLNGNEDFRFPPPPKIQAKHIPDNLVKLLVLQLTTKPVVVVVDGRVRTMVDSYCRLADLYAAWPSVPEKVIQAKVRKMIDRKVLDGCACGCSTALKLAD